MSKNSERKARRYGIEPKAETTGPKWEGEELKAIEKIETAWRGNNSRNVRAYDHMLLFGFRPFRGAVDSLEVVAAR